MPVYVQIADYIEGDIKAGRLREHDRIPTESDMHAEWGVARTTARRAVNLLRERELVYTVPQRGTFVTPQRDSPAAG
ncbi:winged helix-turn-helix domain-containing protein [Actinoplanes sp. TBRC 11911]|uniref:winged helix-turn-helix domain-containing protein n=1 Tax=Actinoplanes sp. TBRC 11911 TaxID=2729386 RepID=UPI00289B637C|nr:winged helix-turn-helix domain-containing protein [Actinoplanes sp. TBRC 11911]